MISYDYVYILIYILYILVYVHVNYIYACIVCTYKWIYSFSMCTHSKELRMRSARPHTFGDVQSMNSWKDRERRVISGVRHGFSLNIPMVSSCFIKKILGSPGDHRKHPLNWSRSSLGWKSSQKNPSSAIGGWCFYHLVMEKRRNMEKLLGMVYSSLD